MKKERVSNGIVCVRKTKKCEALLVRNRFSYSLNYIVHGRYNHQSDEYMIRLLSGTTVDEKHDMLTLDYDRIWYRVWLHAKRPTNSYVAGRRKFMAAFVMDGGARLRSLIARSGSSQLLWEIPKGKKKYKNEPDIRCSIREFGEETGINRDDYKVFPEAIRRYSYFDDGAKYTNIYYFALARPDLRVGVSFRTEQHFEISDIQWMDINTVRALAPRYEAVCRAAINYCKRHG